MHKIIKDLLIKEIKDINKEIIHAGSYRKRHQETVDKFTQKEKDLKLLKIEVEKVLNE